MSYAEQNLYARAAQLVGDKDPREHEFAVQLRAWDAARSGAKLGVATLLALCSALLRKSIRGGLIVVGELTIGGSIEPVHNAVTLAEIAVEKGALALLLPVGARRDLVGSLGRHGDKGRRAVLQGCAGCAAEGDGGIDRNPWMKTVVTTPIDRSHGSKMTSSTEGHSLLR